MQTLTQFTLHMMTYQLCHIKWLVFLTYLYHSILYVLTWLHSFSATTYNVLWAPINLLLELIKLSQWFLSNKLLLNAGKTNYMIFDFKVNVCASWKFSLRIDGNEIKRVYCIKFLGVHVDSSLNWKTHSYQLSLKVSIV